MNSSQAAHHCVGVLRCFYWRITFKVIHPLHHTLNHIISAVIEAKEPFSCIESKPSYILVYSPLVYVNDVLRQKFILDVLLFSKSEKKKKI